MVRTISVKGVGSVSAKPDYIVLSLTITAKEKEYEKAMDDASRRIEQLEGAAGRMGFEKGALKTVSFHVNTQYENLPDGRNGFQRVFSGYACVYHLKLAFDFDSRRLAAVLTEIAGSGAQPELNISFTVKAPEKVSEQLLASAAADAREKAEILCRASGVELGQLVHIQYNWNKLNIVSPTRYEMEDCVMPLMAARSARAPEIEPDNIDLHDSAAFIWEIG